MSPISTTVSSDFRSALYHSTALLIDFGAIGQWKSGGCGHAIRSQNGPLLMLARC